MSQEVDSRVVQMQFDNQGFAEKVSATLSALQLLTSRINALPASSGIDSLSGNVETLSSRFSALGIIGMTALQNITNSAVNTGKRILSALTIAPPKDGLQEYETQLNSVQTILANTKSKGTTLKDVNKALDELNTYADKTIYNFSQMTRNIGTFTAAGVDLKTSVDAIQGIANLAAVSGSSSQQASTAMYQLSQALATGTVKLQDWNSVVNAGMGGEVFQNALTRTAAVMDGAAEDVDAWRKKNIDSYGSFRESLTQGQWLTTDVLTATLKQFTLANNEESKALLKSQGYTEAQIKEILEMGETAMDAATKVKTFTQLIDTLKEALGSGWAQTWRIVIGDFEQARTLWTAVSDELNDIINRQSEARNKLFEGWSKKGGRNDLIEGLKALYHALIVIPMLAKDAFDDIFPPMTVKNLVEITKRFKEFAQSLVIYDENYQWQNITDFFRGLFSVVKVGVNILTGFGNILGTILSKLAPLSSVIFKAGGAFGRFLQGTSDAIVKTEILSKTSDVLANALDRASAAISAAGKKLLQIFAPVVQVVKNAFANLASIFGDSDKMAKAFKVGTLAAILTTFTMFIKKLADPLGVLKGLVGDVFKPLSKVFSDIKGASGSIKETFSTIKYGLSLITGGVQAHIIRSIATSMVMLALAAALLASINGRKLMKAMIALEVMALELSYTVKILSKLKVNDKRMTALGKSMVSLAIAMAIMAYALKSVASLDWEELARGIIGLVAITAMMVALGKAFSGPKAKKMTKGLSGMILMAAAIKIVVSAMSDIAKLSWKEIEKGLVGLGIVMAEMAAFSKLSKGGVFKGIAIVEMAVAMNILAKAVESFASLDMNSLKKGLGGLAAAMAEMAIFTNLTKGGVLKGAALIEMAAAMNILAGAVKTFAGMKLDSLKQGIIAIGAIFAVMAAFSRLSAGGIKMAMIGGSLISISIALSMLVPVLLALGKVKPETLIQGLAGLAGSLAVLGIAGKLLVPVIPALLGLGVAMVLIGGGLTLLGTGLVTIGSGLVTIAAGIGSLAIAVTTNITAIATSFVILVQTVINTIAEIAGAIAEGFVIFVEKIAENMPRLVIAIGKMIQALVIGIKENVPLIIDAAITIFDAFLVALSEHMESMVSAGLQIVNGLLQGIRDNIGELINSGYEVVVAFINGIAEAVRANAAPMRAAAINLMKAFVEAILVFLGIHSPSTVAIGIGKNFVLGLITGVSSIGKNVLNAAKKLGSYLVKGVKSAKNLVEAGREKVKTFISGLGSKIGDVKNKATEIANAVKNKLSGKALSLYNSGVNAVQGFIRGLGSKLSSVRDKATEIARTALEAAKARLKEHSPSREMFKIGDYAVQGFINGIVNLSSRVKSAGENIADNFIETFDKLSSDVNDAMDDINTDFDPTIKPVVDLTDVERGFNTIDGYFSRRQALAIESGYSSANKFDDNTQLISAIGKMISAMEDEGNATYQFVAPVNIDGREVARSTVVYTQEELNKLQTRSNRRLGLV